MPEPTQLALFNHFFAVLDPPTIAAIEASEPLREFAAYERHSVTANNGESWTGRYIYGRTTYLELFGLGDFEGAGVGDAGIGLSVEVIGDLAKLVARLEARQVPHRQELRKRVVGDTEIDWFHGLELDSDGAKLEIWAMEYLPSYMNNPVNGKKPSKDPADVISRERNLGDTFRDHTMRDITGFSLAAARAEIDAALPFFRAAGFDISGGETVELRGQSATIALIPVEPERRGLREIRFRLNAPVEAERRLELGSSVLAIGPGDRAVWSFAAR